MRLLKPSWLHHDGNPIFSIDIHPDDTRVVTGGQGNDSVGRVVIWNMQPILSRDGKVSSSKLLCQLDHHNACVNCVRWSTSGKYLCSGGDDRVIIVWKLVSRYTGNLHSAASPQNSAFGKTNLEQWKPSCMLRSHTGDILDLAWSPGDKYLASASVDNTVIVWDAQNFPQIITCLKEHQSLVKGVTWDPVGKYLASQSDDKTLKVWRVSDWELEQSVQDPFMECGGTTHVLRLDWSPDGLYLVSAHAMNGGGPTAQIVERTEWKTDKDFVGHRKAVVCVKFNGNIMQSEKTRVKHCCVALGSRDRSVSIWSTALKRPLVVIKDLFTNSVMDVSWSSCGTVMMACSGDGTVAVAQFSWKEIGKPLTHQEKASFFHKVYGKSEAVPTENCDIVQNLEVFLAKASSGTGDSPDNSKSGIERRISPDKVEVLPQPERVVKGPIDKQIETRTADGRRRITPKFLLPPTDGEEPETPKSEQAIFMQVKCKDIPNEESTVNWRKNMVSSIENVKRLNETSSKTTDGVQKGQQDGKSTSGEALRTVPTDAEEVSPPTCEKNSGAHLPKEDDLTEPMQVDLPKETKSEPSTSQSRKLVNGTGPHASSTERSSIAENPNKGDEGTGKAAALKEKMMNGESSANQDKREAGSSEKSKVLPPPAPLSSKGSGLVNGSVSDTSELSGKPPSTTTKADTTSSLPKKDVAPGDAIPGIIRPKKKHHFEESSKPMKKVKLTPVGEVASTATPTQPPALKLKELQNQNLHGAPSLASSHLGTGGGQRLSAGSASGGGKPESTRNRLPPMKTQSVLQAEVETRPDCSYVLQVTNHHKRADGLCHQVVCVHGPSSLNGLEWTVCTDAPICFVAGDVHRIVVLCENSTAHVLDTKGRYTFPPVILAGFPSKCVQSGPFLAVVTTKASIHVWNIHTKRVVVKSETLLPLLNQSDAEKDRPLDIARIQVAAGGLPIIILNTGKTFMYSLELSTWFLLSDPRGLVSSPLLPGPADQSMASRILFGDGRFRSKTEPAIISHIKLKLATNTETKNADGIKQWLIALAKSLATHGLEKELHQLLEDLLGPAHSSAKLTSNWVPAIAGLVDKRKLLRQILKLLLEDLKYQDLYSEFDELLREVEMQNEEDAAGVPTAT